MEKTLHTYKIFVLILICCFSTYYVKAQSDTAAVYRGFSGGMMLHTGYLSGNSFTIYDMQGEAIKSITNRGVPFGIGGALRFHLGKHARIGMEGGVSHLIYGKEKNRWSLGWGGILADCSWQFKKWTLMTGGIIGGGSVRNIVYLNAVSSDFAVENLIMYRKFGCLLVTPFVGVEYALTPRMHLIGKIDYMFNILHAPSDYADGARLYIGFLFYHTKN
ncbi:MAG TPA: hypothetical protein PK740_05750 [Bacteroidales bacterium]|nr:hypothetical protein [Bacteroidales bacterium]